MNRFVRTNALKWAALSCALAPLCEVRAQDETGRASAAAGPEQQSVLVLQDGGVLVGTITREADRYLLTRGGGEMQVAAANVMLLAKSMDEAYEQRRQLITHPTAEAHLILADWCLRHDLLAQAQQELTDARGLDSQHGRLALLERRLAMASEQSKNKAAVQPFTKQNRRGLAHFAESSEQNVPVPLSADGSGIGSQSQSPAVEQPEPVLFSFHDLPDGVVERFTRRVQPVLVNNCTTAGCHQPGGDQKFQLDRAILRGLANRRSTTHNLAATLALIDRDRPQLSPLLTVPRRTHGGIKGPIFGPRQDQAFRHLVDWVALVTEATPSERAIPTPSVEPAANLETKPQTASDVAQAQFDEAGSPSPGSPRLRYGARLHRWRPRDPFDPEIFNRRNVSRPKADAAGAQPDENR